MFASFPSDKSFVQMVSRASEITNIDFCPPDVTNANHIYGSDLRGHRRNLMKFEARSCLQGSSKCA